MKDTLKPKRAFIFDPCFGSMSGHWENYCKRFYEELKNRNYELCVYGQEKYLPSIVSDLNFYPLFNESAHAAIYSSDDFTQYKIETLNKLSRINEEDFREGDILFFQSLSPQSLAAILDWTASLVARISVKIVVLMQLPPPLDVSRSSHLLLKKIYRKVKNTLKGRRPIPGFQWLYTDYVDYYRNLNRKLHKLVQNESHYLFASTEALSKNFSLMFETPFHCLPMPGQPLDWNQIARHNKYQQTNKTIQIGYFGHACLAKGGQFIKPVVLKALHNFADVRFVLHINPNHEVKTHLDHFTHHSYPNIECHFGHLDQSKMQILMSLVDIVLLPYAPSKYAAMPSAIFMEAVALKKIIVIPKGTWMEMEAKKYDIGYVLIEKFHEKYILKALNEALLRFEELKRKSELGGDRYYQFNNMTNYFNQMEKIFLPIN